MSESTIRRPDAARDDVGPTAPVREGGREGATPADSHTEDEVRPVVSSDEQITAIIAEAIYVPLQRVWQDYEERAWRPLVRVLEAGVAGHRRALGGISADAATESRQRYRSAVAEDVIGPIRAAVAGSAAALSLEESLASTTGRVRTSLTTLPASVEAPLTRSPRSQPAGTGIVRTVKRGAARVLDPRFRSSRSRQVSVASLARSHLDQFTLHAETRAFRTSQRARAAWLGRLERAVDEWVAAELVPSDDPDHKTQTDGDRGGPKLSPGSALQSELQALLEQAIRRSTREPGAAYAAAKVSLRASVAVAGTWAADPPSKRPPTLRQKELARRWDAWAEGTTARLELYDHLVAARVQADALVRSVQDEWSGIGRTTDIILAETERELRSNRDSLERLIPETANLATALQAIGARTDEALASISRSLPDPEALLDRLASQAQHAIDGLDAMRLRMPAVLAVHSIPKPGEVPTTPSPNHRTVELRDVAIQAFDTLRLERIRAASEAIRDAVRGVRSEVDEVSAVVAYGFESSSAVLTEGREAGSDGPIALVANGLSRGSEKVAAARELLAEAVRTANARLDHEVGEGIHQLVQHATADRVTSGYFEARSYLAGRLVGGGRRLREGLVQVDNHLRRALIDVAGMLPRFARGLGIGTGVSTVTGSQESTLAFMEEVPAALPLVYRRLFSMVPLTDARLLVGRERELEAVAAAWGRRKAGDGRSVLVTAAPGAGVTSFLNITAQRLAKGGANGIRETFCERIRDEARLASTLERWLGIGNGCDCDLDALADRVLESSPGTVPHYAVLERAEHLYIRAPGGSDLIERMLTFMSRTSSRVFWILAMTSSAWQLVEKRSPNFVDDVDRVPLLPLPADQLRQAILARHRLSGVPLQYAEPRNWRAALRRQTRRLCRRTKARGLAETDYFKRLHHACLGSIRLGLFHWLRSADFSSVEGSLLMQPLTTPEAGTDKLDLARSFALKAIMDHASLSLREYCEVTRTPSSESLHLLGGLEGDRFIEKVCDGFGTEPQEPHAHGGEPRYRIRPLMMGPVARHLRSLNISH